MGYNENGLKVDRRNTLFLWWYVAQKTFINRNFSLICLTVIRKQNGYNMFRDILTQLTQLT